MSGADRNEQEADWPWGVYPTAAREYEGDDGCAYETCENEADYVVQFEGNLEEPVTSKICQPCSNRNRVYAKENDLLEAEVTADAGE